MAHINKRSIRGIARKLAFAATAMGIALASTGAVADATNGVAGGQNVAAPAERAGGPAVNVTVASSHVLPPDGTSRYQSIFPGETRWFVFGAEAGKTYTVEVLDPYSDLNSNFVGPVGVYNSDGATAPAEAQTDCNRNTIAPSFEVSADGVRCVIRTFVPTATTTINKRAIFVSVGYGGGTGFQIRVRESTIYGRWTANGYDFHVELQNTTSDAVCAQVVFYPGSGEPLPTGVVKAQNVNVPAMGAAKYVLPSGTTVNGDNKGTLRVHACPGEVNLVPGALNVGTYGYNTAADKYLYLFTSSANDGSTSSSW